jgi:dephospho-CoA kinase
LYRPSRPSRPYCVGLTGGVGSGKSTVAQLFAGLGAERVDTDVIAHDLTAPGGAAMAAIAADFGDEMVAANGSLNRAAMRARVFADATARRRLEALLHPLIRDETARWMAQARAPYVLLIVPLLVENLAVYRADMDRIAVVDCAEALQIERTARRPGVGIEQARAILTAQSSRTARLAIADDVIENQTSLADLDARVRALHQRYLSQAQETQ